MLGYSGMLDPAVFMASLEHKFAAKGAEIVELNRKALNKGLEIGCAAKKSCRKEKCMGKYGWDSKIGDLLADDRCVAVFKEILPAALESPLLKLVKGKPVGVVLDSQKKIPQEKRDALKAALEAIE